MQENEKMEKLYKEELEKIFELENIQEYPKELKTTCTDQVVLGNGDK